MWIYPAKPSPWLLFFAQTVLRADLFWNNRVHIRTDDLDRLKGLPQNSGMILTPNHADEEELSDHAGNAERAVRAGFQVLYTTTANADEWDEYEGLYCRAKLRWAAANPRDPDAATIAADAQRWHDAYLRWGRQTLGFGYYLLRRP